MESGDVRKVKNNHTSVESLNVTPFRGKVGGLQVGVGVYEFGGADELVFEICKGVRLLSM